MTNLSTNRLLSLTGADTLAFYKVYFDESGVLPDCPVGVVAGAIATDLSWGILSDAWGRVLKKYGIEKFHATDLNALRGEFKDWDYGLCNAFYAKLVEVMRPNLLVLIGNSVLRTDFEEVKAEFPQLKLSIYQFLLEDAIMTTSRWAKRRKGDHEIAIFVAHPSQPNRTLVTDVFERNVDKIWFREESRITDLVITKRVDDPPFQVADLSCYELFKFY
ncbi:MAG: DUF3800 domain-containing protein, partial [Candidatus Zixiibacteriota bacterium]